MRGVKNCPVLRQKPSPTLALVYPVLCKSPNLRSGRAVTPSHFRAVARTVMFRKTTLFDGSPICISSEAHHHGGKLFEHFFPAKLSALNACSPHGWETSKPDCSKRTRILPPSGSGRKVSRVPSSPPADHENAITKG
jgi:hypothetical protein